MEIKPLSVWIGNDADFWKPSFLAQGLAFVMNHHTSCHPAVAGHSRKSIAQADRHPILISTRSQKTLKYYHEHFQHKGLTEDDLKSGVPAYFVAVPKRSRSDRPGENRAFNGVVFDGCFLFAPLDLFGKNDGGLMPFLRGREFTIEEKRGFEGWIDKIINKQKSSLSPMEARDVKKR